MQGLEKKLKSVMLRSVLGASVLMSGCETPEDYMLGRAALGVVGLSPNLSEGARALTGIGADAAGIGANITAQRESAKRVAGAIENAGKGSYGERNSSQQNLLYQQSIIEQLTKVIPPEQSPYFFFMNNWVDFGNDRIFSFEEFFGIKKEFNLDKEDITMAYLVVRKPGVKGEVVNYKLLTESGTLLMEYTLPPIKVEQTFPYEMLMLYTMFRKCDPNVRMRGNPPDIVDRLDEFGPGTYIAIATYNGEQLRRAKFVITAVTPTPRP